ncbi:unnamed protein product [Ilex paraguariensis]|uniref:Uncharacterized protein n=1 Tax=Ilex paraguariensis TaxID=185542 RepID=A0ABC8STX6_9AQUA
MYRKMHIAYGKVLTDMLDHEKMKRKKMLMPKSEETVRVEASSTAQPQHMQEKLVTGSTIPGLTSLNRPVSSTAAANTVIQMPNIVMNAPSVDRSKQEMVKGSSGNSNNTRTTDALTKKKVKRKPESTLTEAHFRPDKLSSVQVELKHKSHKQAAGPLQRPNVQLAAATSFEQDGRQDVA